MLSRIIDDKDTEEIVIFSRDEKKQHDMRQLFRSDKLRFIVGDIRDKDAIRSAVRGIDFIFHAAALKQVPTGEFFPQEMVKTNILGTQNLLDVAEEEEDVKKVVVLSTDKAVYPINAMGISKAMVEHLVTAKAKISKDTKYCVVRYGNVMASRGSVIPLFIDQIKSGNLVTVTNPKMTRFLLSLDHAIDLVLLAIDKGEQGDVFIKKAPAATVEDIAACLLKIYSANNEIKIIGTRPGEKVHETLATKFELATAEDLEDFYRIRKLSNETPEDFFSSGVKLDEVDDYTSENTERLTLVKLENLLKDQVYIKNELSL
jgi:UDP-glucose 4-epimerase